MDDIPEGVKVITQARNGGAALLVAALALMAFGAWAMHRPGIARIDWVAQAVVFLAGGVMAGFGLAGVLRPARIIITPDGLDIFHVFGARSAAWEEVTAIGRWPGRRSQPGGVRILLMDRAPIDLSLGWPMPPDSLAAVLTGAWKRASPIPAPPKRLAAAG